MKISIHTVVRDAIRLDFHFEQMLRHHVPLADEIIVMEGFSKDDTFERIKDIDPKIKIFRSPWKATESYLDFVELGRVKCTGDWCLKLDADEFLPEWEWDRLRQVLATTDASIVPIDLLNFYGNYRVLHRDPKKIGWPARKGCFHRNREDLEFWGDGANARLKGREPSEGRANEVFEVHHFGAVRDAARLREKWRTQASRDQRHAGKYRDRRRIFALPGFLFSLRPHDWFDPFFLEELEIYDGPLMKVVEDDPDEFTRDGMKLLHHLERTRTP